MNSFRLKTSLKKHAKAPEQYQSIPLWSQQWVAALLPQNEDEKPEILFHAATGDHDHAQHPRYYLQSKDLIFNAYFLHQS